MRLYGIYCPQVLSHPPELLFRLAVGLQDVLKVSELRWRHQPCQRELTGAAGDRNLHRFDGLTCCDSGPLIDQRAALNGKSLSQSGITEVEVPAIDLEV